MALSKYLQVEIVCAIVTGCYVDALICQIVSKASDVLFFDITLSITILYFLSHAQIGSN